MIEIKIILEEKEAKNIADELIRTHVKEKIEMDLSKGTLAELQVANNIKAELKMNQNIHIIDNTKYDKVLIKNKKELNKAIDDFYEFLKEHSSL